MTLLSESTGDNQGVCVHSCHPPLNTCISPPFVCFRSTIKRKASKLVGALLTRAAKSSSSCSSGDGTGSRASSSRATAAASKRPADAAPGAAPTASSASASSLAVSSPVRLARSRSTLVFPQARRKRKSPTKPAARSASGPVLDARPAKRKPQSAHHASSGGASVGGGAILSLLQRLQKQKSTVTKAAEEPQPATVPTSAGSTTPQPKPAAGSSPSTPKRSDSVGGVHDAALSAFSSISAAPAQPATTAATATAAAQPAQPAQRKQGVELSPGTRAALLAMDDDMMALEPMESTAAPQRAAAASSALPLPSTRQHAHTSVPSAAASGTHRTARAAAPPPPPPAASGEEDPFGGLDWAMSTELDLQHIEDRARHQHQLKRSASASTVSSCTTATPGAFAKAMRQTRNAAAAATAAATATATATAKPATEPSPLQPSVSTAANTATADMHDTSAEFNAALDAVMAGLESKRSATAPPTVSVSAGAPQPSAMATGAPPAAAAAVLHPTPTDAALAKLSFQGITFPLGTYGSHNSRFRRFQVISCETRTIRNTSHVEKVLHAVAHTEEPRLDDSAASGPAAGAGAGAGAAASASQRTILLRDEWYGKEGDVAPIRQA